MTTLSLTEIIPHFHERARQFRASIDLMRVGVNGAAVDDVQNMVATADALTQAADHVAMAADELRVLAEAIRRKALGGKGLN